MRRIARNLAARAAHTHLSTMQLLTAAVALIGYGMLLILFRHTMETSLSTVFTTLAHLIGA